MPIRDPEILREIPLFSRLDETERATLAREIDKVQFLAGQNIYTMGDPGGTKFVVQSGLVELYIVDQDGDKIVLETLAPGGLLGELSLLDNHPRSATARALEDTDLLVIDRNDLHLLFSTHPAAALDMISVLAERIRASNLHIQGRVTRNVNEEIAPLLTWGERFSDFLTQLAGDIRFVYASAAWFVIWIVLNMDVIPGIKPFDPFPYGLLTMVVSLEAIFLSLFVLISQNREAARERIRNDIEFKVNLKAEVEIRDLSKQVDELQQLMLQHFSHIQKP